MIISPPVKGGKMTRSRDVEPAQLNTILTTSGGSATVVSYLTDYLAEGAWDDNGNIVYYPKMLKRIPSIENGLWKMLPNGKMEVTYELRKGIKWHDGQEVTADDAVFMWKVVMDPKMPVVSRVGFDLIEKIVVKDKYTFTATFKQPYMYAWSLSSKTGS